MQNSYSVYKFSFLRYIIIGPGIIMLLVFGSLPVMDRFQIELEGVNQLFYYLFILFGFAIGMWIGSALAKTLYIITLVPTGLSLRIQKPMLFSSEKAYDVGWEEIESCGFETYGNGSILRINIVNPRLKLEFMGSIFTTDKDLIPLYNALLVHIEEFNQQHKAELVQVGRAPSFYEGRFALVMAWIFGFLLFIIPLLLLGTYLITGYTLLWSQWAKLAVVYLTGVPIVIGVWYARRKNIK